MYVYRPPWELGNVTRYYAHRPLWTKPQTGAFNRSFEADAARAITALRSKAIGRVVETDTARVWTHSQGKSFLQSSETDLARAIRPLRIHAIGRATETDTAFTFELPVPSHYLGLLAA